MMKLWTGFRIACPSLLLFACLGGNDDGGSGGEFSIQTRISVVAIDRAARTITTHTTHYTCNDTQVVAAEKTSLDHYVILGDQLTIWDDTACDAAVMKGSSTDIVGTWTGSGLGMSQGIPDAYRPTTCPAVPAAGSDSLVEAMFKDLSLTFKVSESEIVMTASGRLCMGEMLAKTFAAMPSDSTGPAVQIISQGCEFVQLKDVKSGTVMRLEGGFKGNAMVVSVTVGGRTCSLATPVPIDGAVPDCKAIVQSQKAYEQCLAGGVAGLGGPTARFLAKVAAGR